MHINLKSRISNVCLVVFLLCFALKLIIGLIAIQIDGESGEQAVKKETNKAVR
jgi:hypothetical protein